MAQSKSFCARPGCGIAFAVHERIGCGNYIAPDSDAGRAIARANKAAAPRLALVTDDVAMFMEWKARLAEVLA